MKEDKEVLVTENQLIRAGHSSYKFLWVLWLMYHLPEREVIENVQGQG